MRIGTRHIGPNHPPFLIAELSGNHNGSLDRALRLVDAAAESGAHAVKLQTYTADTMTLNVDAPGFTIEEADSLWRGRTLYDLYEEAQTPWEWHEPIFSRARELGLLAFSSPFDLSAVEFLEALEVPCYKVASLENGDLRLIHAVASTGKPVIVSTGASTLEEIDDAVQAARDGGCRDLVVLKCTSGYPTPPEEIGLRAIPFLRDRYGCDVGLSDHTLGIGVAIAATALGATVIEKHFIDERSLGGVDADFSAEPHEFSQLANETDRAFRALGDDSIGPAAAEHGTRQRRRSLYVAKDLLQGERLDSTSLRSVRPGFGLPPKYYEHVLGSRVLRDAKAGTPVTWDLIQADLDN